MSQALRILLTLGAFLLTITLAHGLVNLGWFRGAGRQELTVGHLPVT